MYRNESIVVKTEIANSPVIDSLKRIGLPLSITVGGNSIRFRGNPKVSRSFKIIDVPHFSAASYPSLLRMFLCAEFRLLLRRFRMGAPCSILGPSHFLKVSRCQRPAGTLKLFEMSGIRFLGRIGYRARPTEEDYKRRAPHF